MATAKEELIRFAEAASEQDALTALAVLENRAPEEVRAALARAGAPHPDSVAIDRDIAAGRTETFDSEAAFESALQEREKPE
jgi:hypothetical protein